MNLGHRIGFTARVVLRDVLDRYREWRYGNPLKLPGNSAGLRLGFLR